MRQFVIECVMMVSSFHPLIFVHEMGHFAMMKRYGYIIHHVRVGFPVIFRKGLFRFGIIPLSGNVCGEMSQETSRQAISVSIAGPMSELVASSSALVLSLALELQMCTIFYQHWSFGCILNLFPTCSPNNEDQSSDGSIIWINQPKIMRWFGFLAQTIMTTMNSFFGTGRLCLEVIKNMEYFI